MMKFEGNYTLVFHYDVLEHSEISFVKASLFSTGNIVGRPESILAPFATLISKYLEPLIESNSSAAMSILSFELHILSCYFSTNAIYF